MKDTKLSWESHLSVIYGRSPKRDVICYVNKTTPDAAGLIICNLSIFLESMDSPLLISQHEYNFPFVDDETTKEYCERIYDLHKNLSERGWE